MKQRPRLKYGQNNPWYDAKYSDDSGDDIDLPVRKTAKPQSYIEAQVQDGDTLQAIAIKFNCSVSRLMRANNILRENEIFAKKVLRIPITAYSLITESLPSVHTSGTNSPTKPQTVKEIEKTSNNSSIELSNEFQQKLIVASVNASEIQNPKCLSEPLPNNKLHCAELNNVSISNNNVNIIEEDDINLDLPLLGEQRDAVRTAIEDVVIHEFNSKGDDLGIKWINLLICIILLCFIIPFVYVVYIAEHPEKFHHHQDHP